MLIPAAPDRLAELAALLGPGAPASPEVVLDVARACARSARGGYADEEFGRLCRTALAPVLQRLLAAESAAAALRTATARHIAAADHGEDPAPRELLNELAREGIDLGDEIDAAAAVLDAESWAAAFG